MQLIRVVGILLIFFSVKGYGYFNKVTYSYKDREDHLEFKKMLSLLQLGYKDTDLMFYKQENPQNILFLGDYYSEEEGQISLADHIGESLGTTTWIYKTDMAIKDKKINGNIVEQHLDHKKDFPFEDNQFDYIIGRKILCLCEKGSNSCGGIDFASFENQKSFWKEIIRVLNKRNIKSYALIHGFRFGIFPAQERMADRFLERGLRELDKIWGQYLNISVIYTDVTGELNFFAVKITIDKIIPTT